MGAATRPQAHRIGAAAVLGLVLATTPACQRASEPHTRPVPSSGEAGTAAGTKGGPEAKGATGESGTTAASGTLGAIGAAGAGAEDSGGGASTSGPQPGRGADTATGPADATDGSGLTVVVNGDVLVHPPLWRTAQRDAAAAGQGDRFDFRPLLAGLRPIVAGADVAICHLETPVAPDGGPYHGYPSFTVPPQILPALAWAGYDGCTTASNHSLDDGLGGVTRTLTALDAAGLQHTGTWADRRTAGAPMTFTAKGVKLAVVTETYGTNGVPRPANAPWAVRTIDPGRIVASAKAARADIVLVALHWGQEYQAAPTGAQRRIGRILAASGQIDAVYGHHAHVVQPFELVGDTWVLYGLGNAVAHHATRAPGVDDGVTARFTFVPASGGRWRVRHLEYLPTTLLRATGGRPARLLPLARAGSDSAVRAEERARLARAHAEVSSTVRSRGAGEQLREGDVPAR